MSPGGEHEKQCLLYRTFSRPEALLVEVLGEFLGEEPDSFKSINFRGDDQSTNIV